MRPSKTAWLVRAGALALLASFASPAAAAPPEGVAVQTIAQGWQELAGVVPLDDGRLIAWERAGRLWMVDADGTRHAEPMLDISDEVLAWRDHGLLAVAVDPAFLSNGRIYLAYAVDRYFLDNAGTAGYDPTVTSTATATIGRVTRYEADPDEAFAHVHPETRKVLLGATKADGIPLVHQSHGIGSLVFGEDGTLLLSVGDSADYTTFDTGGQLPGSFVSDGLAAGILRPSEDVGAYRAQLRDSLNGKILRLDPETGDGVPSNPWFDAAAPRAPRSRVWAMGLRNPFRMSRVPGTGAHQASEGNPCTLVVSDVGWGTWEEVDVVDHGGANMGWPLYEGHDRHPGYAYLSPACSEAPNPLGGASGCAPFFGFRDLVAQASTDSTGWVNPCVGIAAENCAATDADASADFGGFHGWGYRALRASEGSSIKAWVDQAPAGATLFVRYANGGPDSACTVRVGGTAVATLMLPSTGAWDAWRVASVVMPAAAGPYWLELAGPGNGDPADAPVAVHVDTIIVPADGVLPTIPAALRRGAQVAPVIDWKHGEPLARTLAWEGGAGVARQVGTVGGAAGESFGGSCAIACAPIALDTWPAAWQGRLWFADFADGWIRAATLQGGVVTRIDLFDRRQGGIVGIYPAADGQAFYVVEFGGSLVRYAWNPSGNRPPVARASASPEWGPGPLAVTLDAGQSTDPDGGPIAFRWEFDDGTPPASGARVVHVFAGNGTPTVHRVHLVATDAAGATSAVDLRTWTDDTPPDVRILSAQDGELYPVDRETVLPLRAWVADDETPGACTCEWRVALHHNTHVHPEPPDASCVSSAVISPLGCGTDSYWVTLQFTATDPQGLSASRTVRLDPDCTGILACRADLNHDRRVDGLDLTMLLERWGLPAGEAWQADLDGDGAVGGGDLSLLLERWGACPPP